MKSDDKILKATKKLARAIVKAYGKLQQKNLKIKTKQKVYKYFKVLI